MAKHEDCMNEASAEMLLHKYTEAYNRKKEAEEEMAILEKEAAETLCVYQLGQEFVDRSGNHVVLVEIKPSTFSMQYRAYGQEPSIRFNYNFRKVRKDGQLSLNHFYISIHDSTPTGKVWNLKDS